MDIHRQAWNRQQQILKLALSHPQEHPEWLGIFLKQHAQVHSSALSADEDWSFEDEVLSGLDDNFLRQIPRQGEHSIAWVLFHLARIEDVTMNMLVAGREQLYEREDWRDLMHVPIIDTGNAYSVGDVVRFSQMIDIRNLHAYRVAIGWCTNRIVNQLTPMELSQRIDATRIEKVRLSGAVVAAASEIIDYWSKRTIAGLLLMPPTRHCFLHLNEALRIRKALINPAVSTL